MQEIIIILKNLINMQTMLLKELILRAKINKIFDTFEPDVLINFAAETHVDRLLIHLEIFFLQIF